MFFFRQTISWDDGNLSGRKVLIDLNFPPTAPPCFHSGSWSAGWANVEGGEGGWDDDHVTLVWKGVKQETRFLCLSVEFRTEGGKVYSRHELGRGSFPRQVDGSFKGPKQFSRPVMLMELTAEVEVERNASREEGQVFAGPFHLV